LYDDNFYIDLNVDILNLKISCTYTVLSLSSIKNIEKARLFLKKLRKCHIPGPRFLLKI